VGLALLMAGLIMPSSAEERCPLRVVIAGGGPAGALSALYFGQRWQPRDVMMSRCVQLLHLPASIALHSQHIRKRSRGVPFASALQQLAAQNPHREPAVVCALSLSRAAAATWTCSRRATPLPSRAPETRSAATATCSSASRSMRTGWAPSRCSSFHRFYCCCCCCTAV
jgi:hypothetical protein